MDQFLHMGGYARYVWPSYGLALLVLGWNIWSALRLGRVARQRAERRLATTPPDRRDRGDH